MIKKVDGVMVCSSYGYEAEQEGDAEEFISTTEQTGDELIETSEDANFEGKPADKNVTCDDCGNGKAWYTIKQTGSADEPPTRFLNVLSVGIAGGSIIDSISTTLIWRFQTETANPQIET
jgi:DNA-directed RNA polymerase subunit M